MIFARCPWYVAGPLLGLLIVLLRFAVNKPLGALGGYIDVFDRLAGRRQLGFSAFFLIGAVLGSALYGLTAGALEPTWAYDGTMLTAVDGTGWQLVVLAVAGVAMGVGARAAGGCTSGHGLSGNALCSPASMAASMTFFATAVVLSLAFAWLTGGL